MTAYDYDAADKELKEKLPEEERCLLTTAYDVSNQMVTSGVIDALNHLYADHEQIEALDFCVGLLKFVVYAGHMEADFFHRFHVKALPRFDPAANNQQFEEAKAILERMRIEKATEESRNHVRH